MQSLDKSLKLKRVWLCWKFNEVGSNNKDMISNIIPVREKASRYKIIAFLRSIPSDDLATQEVHYSQSHIIVLIERTTITVLFKNLATNSYIHIKLRIIKQRKHYHIFVLSRSRTQ